MTWNGKIESIDDTTANLFTINISLSPPFDRCSILYVESRDYRLPTISTRPIAFGFDDTRRFPYSTSFHFEGRAPFLLARITYGNHACTPRNKRSETEQRLHNFSLSGSARRLREPAPARWLRSHLVHAHVESTFRGRDVAVQRDPFNDRAQIVVQVFPELYAFRFRVYIVGTSPNDKPIGAEVRDFS